MASKYLENDSEGLEPQHQIYYVESDDLSRYNPEDGTEVPVDDTETDSEGEDIDLDPRELRGTQAAVAAAVGIDGDFDPDLEGRLNERITRILADFDQLSEEQRHHVSRREVALTLLRDKTLEASDLPDQRLIGISEEGELLLASGRGEPDLLFEEPSRMEEIARDLGLELFPADESLLSQYERIVGHPVAWVPSGWTAPRSNELVKVKETVHSVDSEKSQTQVEPINFDDRYTDLAPVLPRYEPKTYGQLTHPGIATVILAGGESQRWDCGDIFHGKTLQGINPAPHIGTRLLRRVQTRKQA